MQSQVVGKAERVEGVRDPSRLRRFDQPLQRTEVDAVGVVDENTYIDVRHRIAWKVGPRPLRHCDTSAFVYLDATTH